MANVNAVGALSEVGRVAPRGHSVGFYDDDDGLVAAVTGFVASALSSDGSVAILTTAAHRIAVERALRSAGIDPVALAAAGRYQWIDAVGLLATFMRDGRPEPEQFTRVLGQIVADASRDNRPVFMFGEMVSVLCDEGNVAAVIEIETLGDDLAARRDFTLQCGYTLSSLERHGGLAAAKAVCDRHSEVMLLQRAHGEPLAHDGTAERMFVPDPASLREVREFVRRALGASHGGDGENAVIVANELATNALTHAKSPFTVAVTCTPSRVRIAVRDVSAPAPNERFSAREQAGALGIAIIAALSDVWGVDPEPDGKSIWAELARH